MRSLLFGSLFALAACTGAATPAADKRAGAPIWSYASSHSDLRAQSCPNGTAFAKADALDLQIIEAELGSEDARSRNLSGMTLAGAWQLRSENSEFGGLSGLSVLPSGSLLAVTDDGKFAWIGIDPDSTYPDGTGAIAYMRDRDGKIFPSKRAADAEDLTVRDGLAFVSFEQDHRIYAYDLSTCGTAAHAALVTSLDKVVGNKVLQNNRGAEAVAFAGDALRVGFEARESVGSPIGTVRTDGTLAEFANTQQPALYLLTGMDSTSEISAYVFRAYDPVRGSRAIIKVERDGQPIASARLQSPLPVDNFEGIAIGTSPAGARRLWVLSDNNFNTGQRTLLLALDLTD
ncbi:MAG: esterase-like activity of phytase family protein [Pseudomonadota bacterium]